jgi:hypothetical protein
MGNRVMFEMVSSGKSLATGFRSHASTALRHPAKFAFSKPFGIVWTLYAATYTVANSTETLATEFHQAAAGVITFIATTVVNVPLGVWKDLRFAHLFGAGAVAGKTGLTTSPALARVKVPKAAAATFVVRDAVTIYGCFTLAPWLAGAVPDEYLTNPHAKAAFAQLTVPMLSQVVATPVHLLGLDLYNRQHGISIGDRASRVRRDLPYATVVRCMRIIPAFGIGCLANVELRSHFHRVSPVEEHDSLEAIKIRGI